MGLGAKKWAEGLVEDFATAGVWIPKDRTWKYSYKDWSGRRPKAKDYMPQWADDEATMYMMYETCTEGTPISPAFSTREGLARWLTDSEASAVGNQGASYEGWLRVCYGGYAPSFVCDNTGIRSGVDL